MHSFSILKLPIIIGEFNLTTIGWCMLLVLYACMAMYAFATIISRKNESVGTDDCKNQASSFLVSLYTSQDTNGNPCWSATTADAEGVVGTGASPAEAVDDLLSRVDNQKKFEKFCSAETESEETK